jgi:hypothetical protein
MRQMALPGKRSAEPLASLVRLCRKVKGLWRAFWRALQYTMSQMRKILHAPNLSSRITGAAIPVSRTLRHQSESTAHRTLNFFTYLPSISVFSPSRKPAYTLVDAGRTPPTTYHFRLRFKFGEPESSICSPPLELFFSKLPSRRFEIQRRRPSNFGRVRPRIEAVLVNVCSLAAVTTGPYTSDRLQLMSGSQVSNFTLHSCRPGMAVGRVKHSAVTADFNSRSRPFLFQRQNIVNVIGLVTSKDALSAIAG